MHATCLHCTKPLGTNAVLETLPIGRRIAFDAAQGRLWVVCRACARWNLVPFDTRLETIDAAERLFRDTHTRYSTDNIGLARLREGLELVRIGPALRPEFAAWRYGDAFGKRTRRAIITGVAGGALGLGVVSGGAALGVSLGLSVAMNALNWGEQTLRPLVRVPQRDGPPLALSRRQMRNATLRPDEDGSWLLSTATLKSTPSTRWFARSSREVREFRGEPAQLLLAAMLAQTNAMAGSQRNVRAAVEWVEMHRTVDRVIASQPEVTAYTKVANLPSAYRLALEMSLHEETERAALGGELRLLEWQWREAERLATIADGLALEE